MGKRNFEASKRRESARPVRDRSGAAVVSPRKVDRTSPGLAADIRTLSAALGREPAVPKFTFDALIELERLKQLKATRDRMAARDERHVA